VNIFRSPPSWEVPDRIIFYQPSALSALLIRPVYVPNGRSCLTGPFVLMNLGAKTQQLPISSVERPNVVLNSSGSNPLQLSLPPSIKEESQPVAGGHATENAVSFEGAW
jgi:hypothetical protein